MEKDVSLSKAITDMIEWVNGKDIPEFQKGVVAGLQIACGMADIFELFTEGW